MPDHQPPAGHGDQAIDKIGALRRWWNRNWSPSQLVGRGGNLLKRRAAHGSHIYRFEWLVCNGWTHPVQPRPPIDSARGGEGRAAELLRV